MDTSAITPPTYSDYGRPPVWDRESLLARGRERDNARANDHEYDSSKDPYSDLVLLYSLARNLHNLREGATPEQVKNYEEELLFQREEAIAKRVANCLLIMKIVFGESRV